jgi:hypothetical protein
MAVKTGILNTCKNEWGEKIKMKILHLTPSSYDKDNI